MNGFFTKYLSKFFIQQWIIGVAEASLEEIIRTKNFNTGFHWIPVPSKEKLEADPFILDTGDGGFDILFEDYSLSDACGKIAVMSLDKQFRVINKKLLLDTGSHLSYPFIYREEGKIFVFPESASAGSLCCYEYNPVKKEFIFLKEIIKEPLLDSTIIFHQQKYWLFATRKGSWSDQQLHLYYADSLLGEYKPHPRNPLVDDLSGARPAGHIISVDGELYRPAQNSRYTYGGSITLQRITRLDEQEYAETFYMNLSPDRNRKENKGIYGFHTINAAGKWLVADGTVWRFSLLLKFRQWALKFGGGRKNNQIKKEALTG
jgi:hypothetical protein